MGLIEAGLKLSGIFILPSPAITDCDELKRNAVGVIPGVSATAVHIVRLDYSRVVHLVKHKIG